MPDRCPSSKLGTCAARVRLRIALLTMLSGALAACSGGDGGGGTTGPPPLPQPGTLVLRLTSPQADDRAARIQVSGGAVSAVRAPSSDLTVYGAPGASGALVIAIGSLASGIVAQLDVPDVNRAASYRATLVEVADSRYALRPAVLDGYTVAVGR